MCIKKSVRFAHLYGTKAVAIGGEKAINAAKDKILAAVKDTKDAK